MLVIDSIFVFQAGDLCLRGVSLVCIEGFGESVIVPAEELIVLMFARRDRFQA